MKQLLKVKILFWIMLILLAEVKILNSLQEKASTYKAVFIERFIRFIEWPNNNNPTISNSPLIITIIGNSDITQELKKISTIQTNHTIEIKQISSISALTNTHIVFIPEEKQNELEKIINNVKKKGILIVSEIHGATNYGAHINFFIESNKLRFEINEKAVFEAGFNVSYLLLKSAKVLNPRK